MKTDVLNAGEGEAVWIVGDRYTFKLRGADTGGAFALIEALVPPGGGPPPHSHSREDEAFYVLEGEISFHADGRKFTAGPGAWVMLAKGSVHGFRNDTAKPAKMLINVIPAGLDDFFMEIGRPAAEGEEVSDPPTPEEIQKLIDLAPKYGLTIFAPEH